MQIAEAAALSQTLLTTLQQVIVGKDTVLQYLLLGLYSGGNILIEDFPGLAKTLTARLVAQATGLEFKRIQFTPDLLPGDITGGLMYNQRRGEFEFRPGPLFTNLVLADEINRAPPKTQAALLEVMQEQQVTIEGTTHPVPLPFVVLATQNPIELEGTYPCRKPSSTVLSCVCVWATLMRNKNARSWCSVARRQEKIDLQPVINASAIARYAGRGRAGAHERRGGALYCQSQYRHPTASAGAHWRFATRLARSVSTGACLCYGAAPGFCVAG